MGDRRVVAAAAADAAEHAAGALAATRFVPNRGQWADAVRFATLGANAAWLHDDGFTVRFERQARRVDSRQLAREGRSPASGGILRTRFAGSAEAVVGDAPLPGVYHFLCGDRCRWARDVPAFGCVTMRRVLPGIDVLFRDVEGGGAVFEYDLLLDRGADLDAFVARCEGASALRIDAAGQLNITLPTPHGPVELVQHRPIAWQQTAAGRRPLAVEFRLVGDLGYGFIAVDLDPRWPTVVDPGVAWSTFLGGGASDSVNDLDWVPGTAIWVAGWAGSLDFPTTTGAWQATGERDGFVARLDENGNALHYATYFGGSDFDEVRGIDLGPGLTPTIVGVTASTDLPVSNNALQPAYGGANPIVPIGDAFVARLSANGDALLSSTYLGGAFDEVAEAVAVDSQGHAHVVGWTSSGNFPTTAGSWQPAFGGPLTLQTDGFVARIAPDAQSASYSTFVGSSHNDQLFDVALDAASGDVVVIGWSSSPSFPTTPLAYRTSNAGTVDMVITRLQAGGAGPVWSTFLGGIGEDIANGVALGANGTVWIGGWSDSTNYPVTSGAPQPVLSGEEDGVVTQLSAGGTSLVFSTFLGGPDGDQVRDIAVDGADVMVVGEGGAGFPLTFDAAQATFGGGLLDGFVTWYTNSGSTVSYSSYAGGSSWDDVFAAVELSGGLAVFGGWSFAADFPVTGGALQTQLLGAEDGVVMMLDLLADLAGGLAISAPAGSGSRYAQSGVQEVLSIDAENTSSRTLTVDAVRVFVAGRGFTPSQVRDLEVWLDDPATLGVMDVRLGGPVTPAIDDAEVEITLTGLHIAAGTTARLGVFADLIGDDSQGTVEVVCAVVGPDAFDLRAFGAGNGPTAHVVGGGRAAGPTFVTGALPGDDDGDGLFSVFDLRRMCVRLGAFDPLVDADGDQRITLADVAITHNAVLGIPSLVHAPAVAPRAAWLTIHGVFPVSGSIDASLGGRSLLLGCLSPRELTLFVDATQSTGTQDLIVYVDGKVVVAGQVLVQ